MRTTRGQGETREEMFGEGALVRKVDRSGDGSYVVRTYRVENSLWGKSVNVGRRDEKSEARVAVLSTSVAPGDVEVEDALVSDITRLFDAIDAHIAEEQAAMSALLRRLLVPA